jgi:predicted dehydrogenase
MKYKVGVVGIGFGLGVHVPAFRLDSRCEVAAICASTAERAVEAACKAGIPNSVGDWRELVADPEIDVVSIATPAGAQFEIAREAVAAGKHVFLEKPLASTADQGRELVELAEERSVRTSVDFEFVETPGWPELKSALEAGEFGDLRIVNLDWQVNSYAIQNGFFDSWKLRPAQDGGVLNLFGTHTFHYLEWLFGPIRRLRAHLPGMPGLPREVEALALLQIEFENGAQGSVSLSSASFQGNGHRLEIYGSAGSACLSNPTKDYIRGFELEIGAVATWERRRIELAEDDDQQRDGRIAPVGCMVRRFVDAIEEDRECSPNVADGWRVQRWIDVARASAKSGEWLTFD